MFRQICLGMNDKFYSRKISDLLAPTIIGLLMMPTRVYTNSKFSYASIIPNVNQSSSADNTLIFPP